MAEGFYARDLAHVHDEAFGHMARGGAEALLRRLADLGVSGGLVVDLGCGSGITAAALTAAGFDVLGVDLSTDLLEIARERAPAARFMEESVFEAEIPAGCVAVTAIGEILNYARDERAGRDAMRALFSRVHTALAPGGIFMFDVVEPGRERGGPRRTWHEGSDWTLCFEAVEDHATRRLERRMTIFRRVGGVYERSDERHELWLSPRAEVMADLAEAGFERRHLLSAYGTHVRFDHGHAGFVARR
jgi:SAM-dependent methyltransferase